MKCQPRVLTPYLDGELPDDVHEQVEEHLRSCPSCGAMLDEVTVASERVREMGRSTIPVDSLQVALDLVAERTGISGAVMSQTAEVARAPEPAEEPEPPAPELISAPERGLEPWPSDALEPAATMAAEAAMLGAIAEPPIAEPVPVEPIAEEPGAALPIAESPAVESALVEELPDSVLAAATWTPFVDSAPAPTVAAPDGEAVDAPEPPAAFDPAAPAESEAPVETPDPANPPAEVSLPEDYMRFLRPASGSAIPTTPDAEEPLSHRPDAPPHELRPPWLDAEAADTPDLEEEGRRAVDRAMEMEMEASGEPADEGIETAGTPGHTEGIHDAEPVAEMAPAIPEVEEVLPVRVDETPAEAPMEAPPFEAEPAAAATAWAADPRVEPPPEPWHSVWSAETEQSNDDPALAWEQSEAGAPATGRLGPDHEILAGPQALPEVEEAVARLHGDLASERATGDLDLDDLRRSAERRIAAPRTASRPMVDLRSRRTQLAAGGAVALILLLGVAALAVPRLVVQPGPQASVGTAPAAAGSGTPAAKATPSTTATAPALQLINPVTAGGGGTGYRVSKIRTSTTGGAFRMVLDMTGAGPTPAVTLARGSDGADYLSSDGIEIDPAVLQGLALGGPVTGIAEARPEALHLKVSTNGNPAYAMSYLSGPTRLVIDFK